MSNEEKKAMIQCENLIKIYKTSDIEVVALQGLDLEVQEGEIMAIIGNSGSGKSTLLNMLGGLDKATAGKLVVGGKDLFKLNSGEMVKYKRDTVGFVWQNNARNLLPHLTALENIEEVINIKGRKRKRERALELLSMVGLEKRKNNKLTQLSGGEQQRIAISIAICNNPKILLADEPTGSVDTKTSGEILDLFRKLNSDLNLTVVIVTHDRQIAHKVDRVVAIRDGRTSSELIRKISYAESLKEISSFNDSSRVDTHEELAVIDKTGRVQVPEEYLKILGVKGASKVKIEMDGDKVVIYSSEKAI
jgi:ABC-type lipoprotein export system ATPase subunit